MLLVGEIGLLWALALAAEETSSLQDAPTAKLPAQLIQIGIIPRARELTVACEDPCALTDGWGQHYTLSPRKSYQAQPSEDGLRLGPFSLSSEVRLKPQSPGACLLIGPRRYSGSLILRRNKDATLTAIDELGFEDYLLGVLPHEMEPGWPLEALKAQAVVARSFAYMQIGKYHRAGYDLSSDTRSQVYGGLGEAAPAVRRAVEETHGEVLGYKGQLLDVYYHACCGGHTAHKSAVWKSSETPPPLWGVRDKYCESSPHARWSIFLSYSDILAALQKGDFLEGPLRNFQIGRRDMSGYIRNFLTRIGSRSLNLSANDFRTRVGPGTLKSTRISRMRKTSKGILFSGSGSGHGVGLCQWGARLQAEKGRNYEQILRFYFPGSVLSVIEE
jgi:stage II sporulation protein D